MLLQIKETISFKDLSIYSPSSRVWNSKMFQQLVRH